MKAYIITTGVLFVLLAVAHILRGFQEPALVRDPWFLLTSLIAVGMAGWAYRVFRITDRLKRPPR